MARLRVYQAWKGNNIFICSGRLVFGPDVRSLCVTVLLVLAPVVVFCTLVARKLMHEFPAQSIGYAVLGVAVGFTVLVLVLLFLTAARDPGIIPRNLHPPEEEMVSESTLNEGSVRAPTPTLPRTKDVIVNGTPVKVKYCDTCMLYRPPRCSHCSVCNNCVDRFDHHCPWVGQCIGLRNYRYFFLFISSAALLCIFVLAISALHLKFLVDDSGTLWKGMKKSPASVILILYCFLALWFVGGLTGFHIYLIGTNQTTYENFRSQEDNRRSVFSRGCLKNYGEVFCGNIQPSKIRFRAYVPEEESSRTPRVPTRPAEIDNLFKDRREKVENDLDIGQNLPNLSHRRNAEEGERIQG